MGRIGTMVLVPDELFESNLPDLKLTQKCSFYTLYRTEHLNIPSGSMEPGSPTKNKSVGFLELGNIKDGPKVLGSHGPSSLPLLELFLFGLPLPILRLWRIQQESQRLLRLDLVD